MPPKHLDGLIRAAKQEAAAAGRKVYEEEVAGIVKLLWMHRNNQKRASYRKLMNDMTAEERWGHTKGVARK